jgi:hypothetical protein
MVLPLRTTSRLSVSIVILVVFTTTARSDRSIATPATSIARILGARRQRSLQCAVQYFSMSFKKFYGNECKGLRTDDGNPQSEVGATF